MIFVVAHELEYLVATKYLFFPFHGIDFYFIMILKNFGFFCVWCGTF
jgi:hypothetical protein